MAVEGVGRGSKSSANETEQLPVEKVENEPESSPAGKVENEIEQFSNDDKVESLKIERVGDEIEQVDVVKSSEAPAVEEIHLQAPRVTGEENEASTDESEESSEDLCDSEHLLIKNRESFRCLTQVLLSSSSLMRQRLFFFPPPVDPGINEAFEYVEPPPVYDDIEVEKYEKLCKDFEIVPISRVKNTLAEPVMDLTYYGLTVKQFKALTETLKGNAYVQTLILQDNWLNEEQTRMLSNMIEENSTIRVLILRECRIGEKGAEHLCEAISNSQFLSELDLSHNGLGDKGILMLQRGLCDTISLVKLNISHNELTEDCAVFLDQILMENKSIKDLDLSWNGFYTDIGNKKLFHGLSANDTIRSLNLAWNGMGQIGAVKPLARFVRRAKALEFLDLSNNRLEGTVFRRVKAAVNRNKSLVTLRIGNNPCSADDALSMIAVLPPKAKKGDPLEHLDLENIYLKKEVVPLLQRIQSLGKTVNIGGILSNYTIIGPNIIELLFNRCRYLLMKPKKKKAKKDFGHFILRLPEKPISKQDFEALLKKQKIKRLDKDLLAELENRFAVKKTKVNCPAMTDAYMELWPETCLPPPKPKKKKKGRKGKKNKKKKTTVGEVEKEIAVHDLENAPGPVVKGAGLPMTQSMRDVVEQKPGQLIESTANASKEEIAGGTSVPSQNVLRGGTASPQKVLGEGMASPSQNVLGENGKTTSVLSHNIVVDNK